MSTELTLGFSPCPNDCFIFDAMIHGEIDTEGLSFKVFMEDVESLNRKAFNAELDITKLSYYAYAHLADKYHLLKSGSALGKGCGPLLITRSPMQVNASSKVAIPGKFTTANFLFSIAFPEVTDKAEMLFSEIEAAVLEGKVDAGLIIHENRFTYEAKGLKKLMDLGEYWESMTKAPIPLGGIVIRRTMHPEVKHAVDRVIRRSVEYAFAHPDASLNFVKEHAQEMSEEVMYKHIDLYVNKYSVDLGEEGKKAVHLLFDKAVEFGLVEKKEQDLIV
jgi:1,4-dihydroxy-6-naphthoate synthase